MHVQQLMSAAYELGQEGRLYDPSDDDILIYAAELIGDQTTDLAKLHLHFRQAIIGAYECGVSEAS